MTNADSPEKYDYIIIGAGSSGCVLAAHLAQHSDYSILVLERGKNQDDYEESIKANRWAAVLNSTATLELITEKMSIWEPAVRFYIRPNSPEAEVVTMVWLIFMLLILTSNDGENIQNGPANECDNYSLNLINQLTPVFLQKHR